MELLNEDDLRNSFNDFASEVIDHRVERNKKHSVKEILFLTLIGLICGCDGWRDIERFGKIKIDFLRTFLPFEHGTPSDDTLRLFYRSLDPKMTQKFFSEWAVSLSLLFEDKKHIAIDGKVSRRSYDGEKDPLHLVTAYLSEHSIVLAQESVDTKSNEVKAIPTLLDALDLKNSIVTIDAMGCQKSIAEKIIEKSGDYIFSLKGNHGTLHSDVKLLFESEDVLKLLKMKESHTVDGSEHGRLETRRALCVGCPQILKEQHNWSGLKSFIAIESTREIKGKVSKETRYYISSLEPNAPLILKTIRAHWAIENSLHYILDVSFKEDDSRIRKKNAPKNIAILRHMALNLMQKSKRKRDSIKQMRKAAGWDETFLRRILSQLLFI